MNKEILLELSKTLNIKDELGIWSELDSFFENHDDKIANLSVNYNEDHFNVEIQLKEFNLNMTKTVFALLVEFFEYGHSTFYVREKKENSIEYYLLSSTVDKKAFLMHIIFQ